MEFEVEEAFLLGCELRYGRGCHGDGMVKRRGDRREERDEGYLYCFILFVKSYIYLSVHKIFWPR